MALGLRGKPEGEGRGFEWNVCIYTLENSCLNKAGRVRASPGLGSALEGAGSARGLGRGQGDSRGKG